MPGNEPVEPLLNHDVLAFEYVTGVMRGDERQLFARLLKTNESLADQVRFWEEQLIQLSDEQEQRPLSPDIWANIHSRLQLPPAPTKSPLSLIGVRWFTWAFPSIAILVLAGVLLVIAPQRNTVPNADYVAVLTNTQGAARLTVLTATKGTALWLKWDGLKISPDKNVQLWAISKRDGQVRPLGVFSHTDISQMDLSTASWRLIKDAESLLLTEEDIGGSAIDEPSDVVLAKGVCVLLAKTES